MRSEITGLHRRLGATMIYVTHDQVEAMTMADKIVVLRQGRIEQIGSPLDLYNRPDNRFVAGFIGSPQMNFIPVQAGGDGRVATAHGTNISLAAGQEVGAGTALVLGVRPEHLSLASGAGALGLPIRVSGVEQLGGHCLIYGTLPSDATRITAPVRRTAADAPRRHRHPLRRGCELPPVRSGR